MQRRLSAIFSADVQGYSRLMSQDEAGTLHLLTAYRGIMTDLIGGHHGRVVDAPGDNLLAEFPSIIEAVQCAVEIQHHLRSRNEALPEDRRMEFRIGVNVGDVIVEDERLYGDGVNIAARVEQLADAGGVAMSGTAHDYIEGKLPLEYDDLGEHTVKNIAKPLRVYRVRLQPSAPVRSSPSAAAPPRPEGVSIAVLPFDAFSNDPEEVYFVDGVVEDIITELSTYPDLLVVARNTTFTFKGRPIDVRAVGRELGVRYLLEGSVRRAVDRIRVTAQLIDVPTASHVWAERYDRELSDLFSVQDDITASVVGAIQPALYAAEARRVERVATTSLDVWGCAVRGRWHMWRVTQEDNAEAKRLLSRALELQSDYVPALAFLAYAHIVDVFFGWSPSAAKSIAEAQSLAQRAVTYRYADPWAQCAVGLTAFFARDPDRAIFHFMRAIELNPNFALAHGYLALQLAFAGEPEAAINQGLRAIRLSPRDPELYHFQIAVATGHFVAERYNEAADWARRCLGTREIPAGYRLLAAALGQLGDRSAARDPIERLLRFNPQLTLTTVRQTIFFRRPADLDRYVIGLRQAGLAE